MVTENKTKQALNLSKLVGINVVVVMFKHKAAALLSFSFSPFLLFLLRQMSWFAKLECIRVIVKSISISEKGSVGRWVEEKE